MESKSTHGGFKPEPLNRMEEQARKKRVPPSRKGMGPTSTSFKPGISGNPGGRPRKAFAACEAVREHVDPVEWVNAELAVARDTEKPWETRRDAWRSLIDRGFVRPPAQVDALVHASSARLSEDWESVPLEKRRELLEAMRAARAPQTDASPRLDEPRVPDDNSTQDTGSRTSEDVTP